MLVLSRKLEQSLNLGDDITITVLGIDGDRVKLGGREQCAFHRLGPLPRLQLVWAVLSWVESSLSRCPWVYLWPWREADECAERRELEHLGDGGLCNRVDETTLCCFHSSSPVAASRPYTLDRVSPK